MFFLLFSQLWTNALCYCNWFDLSEEVLIELVNSDNNESEDESEEKNEKEEKKDRQELFSWHLKGSNSKIKANTQYTYTINSLETKKIVTPPPESLA